MKKIKDKIANRRLKKYVLSRFHILIGACFLFAINMGYSQRDESTQTSELLIGKWQLNYSKTIAHFQTAAKEFYNSIGSDKKNQIKSSFEKRQLTFSSDGTYTIEVNPEIKVIGTWSLTDDKGALAIVLPNRNTIIQQIESINETGLLLNLGEGPSSKNLFSKWYLEKLTN